jgi:hypothetical protein
VALGRDALEVRAHGITRLGSPLSMIVFSSAVKPLPRMTTPMMSSSA